MVDILEFLVVLATLAVVVAWYVQNEESVGNAQLGVLALVIDAADLSEGRRSYHIKPRTARRADEMRSLDDIRAASAVAKSSYHVVDEDPAKRRRSFRIREDARFEKRADGPRFRSRTGPTEKLK